MGRAWEGKKYEINGEWFRGLAFVHRLKFTIDLLKLAESSRRRTAWHLV